MSKAGCQEKQLKKRKSSIHRERFIYLFPYMKYMDSQDVKEYLVDFQRRALPELSKRDLKTDESKKIKSIIGPRRAGKTYFFYQKIKELVASGTKKENIMYLNFEDPRLADVSFKEIRDVVKLQWELYPASIDAELHIFMDEPQTMPNWENVARHLHDEGFNLFVTGSSSKLLSREIATSLRGRTLSYALLPLSFSEFLKMKNVSLELARLSSREKSLLLSLLGEYMDFGGFPEIVSESNTETKLRIISEYFNLVVYRDVVERYKIKNTFLIKWLIKSIITSFSKEFSVHKTYLTLKSREIKASKNTLYAYTSMLQDAMFVFFLPKFSYSIRKRELSLSKAYLCDVCFAKLSEVSKDEGKKMENTVFLELERRKGPLTELSYWKDYTGKEVDFVVKEGTSIKELVQVTYASRRDGIEKRELNALINAGKELKCDDLLVITWDYEGEEKSEGIKFVPLWKWLLESSTF